MIKVTRCRVAGSDVSAAGTASLHQATEELDAAGSVISCWLGSAFTMPCSAACERVTAADVVRLTLRLARGVSSAWLRRSVPASTVPCSADCGRVSPADVVRFTLRSAGVVPSVARWSWCRMVGSQNPGMSMPLSRLMLFSRRRMWMASLMRLVYQCCSRSIHRTSSQLGWWPAPQACSATADPSTRESLTSR